MRARDLAVPFPTITTATSALEAARLLAGHNLPGLIVVDDRGCPVTVLPGTEVLRLVIPGYCREDPTLARMIDEPSADLFLRGTEGRTVADVLPRERPEPPVVDPQATVLEVAAVMAQRRSPLVAVAAPRHPMVGGITLDALLDRMLVQ
ncbi:CBS domain-containing protein [Micromonospora halotolerans]|uniref:CBS domain-containing protein n=1 Tax=Micromonospora halotolerans TaxID=709879 RepID=A0ABY9ZWR3_9ACTN|nr:CBS domain-containing protein [Micromonospora halotolerans]WNM39015.1 CBS domain-containing protein [Micromonospora halotolerans]